MYANASLKGWIECGFHSFAHPGCFWSPPTSSREALAVSRETPREGLWKNNMRVYPPPVARTLYKQAGKRGRFWSWLPYHFVDGRFSVFSDFRHNGDAFCPLFAPFLFTVFLSVEFLLLVGFPMEVLGHIYWEARPRPIIPEPAREGMRCFTELLKLTLPHQKELELESLARPHTFE